MAEQRSARRRSLLPQSKIDRLDGVGFDWGPKIRPSHKWHERIEQLRAYREEHGDLDVPYGHAVLGTFVNNTRSQYRMGRLREERVRELTDMGFAFVAPGRKARGTGTGTGGDKAAGSVPVEPPALPELRAPGGASGEEPAGTAGDADAPPPPAPSGTRTDTVRLTVGAGSIGLTVDGPSPGDSPGGRGLAISAVSDGCSFRDHVSVGDRVISVNGRSVVRPGDLTRDEDRDRELVFEVVREAGGGDAAAGGAAEV